MKKENRHFLFFLGHPAHFHLFKNVIKKLEAKGHRVSILIKTKDILEDLLKAAGLKYRNTLPAGRSDGYWGMAMGVLKKNWQLLKFCWTSRPDLMLGTSAEIAHIGTLLRIPSINFTEDDAKVIPLLAKVAYPFSTYVASPRGCNNEQWNSKTLFYDGYHKLAYLHPACFKPDREVVKKYFATETPYYLLRFAKLNAHHDKDAKGFNTTIASKVINLLSQRGNVYITSERDLEPEFEKYRLNINPLDIHHLMSFADMYLGDSQSMAVEAAMLGVPNIRFSNFSGHISVLEDLEHKYGLTQGIRADYPDALLETISNMLSEDDIKARFIQKREAMLKEKIDVTDFFLDLFENYPRSAEALIEKEMLKTK